MGRKNLCKVSPETKTRLNELRGEKSWGEFMREVATLYEEGVQLKIERYGHGTSTQRVDIGDSTTVLSDLMAVTVSPGEQMFECEECGDEYALQSVLISDDRIVCGECITAEDRIIS